MEQKITRTQILQYYSSEKIAKQIFLHSKGREVAGALWDGSYEKRPNVLQFQTDIAQMVRKGVTSFHYSSERWSNPMALIQTNYTEMRTGWDVVIDIDSKLGLEESKLGASLVCRLLEKYGIKNHTVKFSGRRGFHIILPWEMFPGVVDYKPLSAQYPDIPRIIINFIRNSIKDDMMKELSKIESVKNGGNGNPFYYVEVEKDWGSRHMFRAPFSFNEKTWLVSLPIKSGDIDKFSPDDATPEKVLRMEKYQDIFLYEKEEASSLLLNAMDWHAANKKEEEQKPKRTVKYDGRIGEDLFPPCIKAVLEGMADGRKRSIFTMINFLRMMNWSHEEIEARIYEWNEKNRPPLPRTIIAGQLTHATRRDKSPPANCASDMYYTDIGLCRPDEVCRGGKQEITIKNPVNYAFRKIGKRKKKTRGFSCMCGQEFPTMKALNNHKSKSH